ncbi:hypothetical protein ILUMI_15661 [Ignelater luminosus]|uniref:Uncharacterized protein n=1 Tax=Ignelater luminosus TaxID=2038154 RepID=A0A8K0CUB1_IGNLU|nr:hypothetical protein ILUMI_15661 [Ignelater luminosus]
MCFRERYFETFSVICDRLSLMISDKELEGKGSPLIERDRYKDLETAFPNISIDIHPVTWKGKSFFYEQLLSGTFNNWGLAYTFNMLDYSELFNKFADTELERLRNKNKTKKWTLDEGYPKNDHGDTYPRRTFVSGLTGGFSFVGVTAISDAKYSCNAPLSGYKVTLHHPCELPNMDKHFRLPLNQSVFVAVKPRMITISENLKSYKPEDRKCYLTHERELKFFKSYTQQNCEHECILNATWEHCGCLPFYMFIFEDVPLCGSAKMSCVDGIREEYISNNNDNQCNCLPSCTSLVYDVEISQSSEDFNSYLTLAAKLEGKDLNLPVDYSNLSFSLLVVYYKEMQFLRSERNELYGYVDFFSNTGGLMGLFIGFSVTSLIETIYFLTLRLGCNIKMYGKRFWSGAPELINNEEVK